MLKCTMYFAWGTCIIVIKMICIFIYITAKQASLVSECALDCYVYDYPKSLNASFNHGVYAVIKHMNRHLCSLQGSANTALRAGMEKFLKST